MCSSDLLASGSDDKTVRLWDGATGVPIATLEGHSYSVTSLLFSPDGSRLASGSWDNTVRLWDSATGVPIATLEGHSSYVTSLSFSPDGSRLASGSDDNVIRLWDCATGSPIATFKGRPQSVYILSHSPIDSQVSADTILRNRDDDTGGFLQTRPPLSLLSKMISISLRKSTGPSRRYYIHGVVLSSKADIPLLWLPVDIADVIQETFCSKAAAFGCRDGHVIILDLTQLNLQEA